MLDQGGAPIPNVELVVGNAEAGGFRLGGANSGPAGSFTISCLAAAGVGGTGSYYVTAIPPADAGFGHIDSDQPLVAERPMYFALNGRSGGDDAMAVDTSEVATTANFADGFVEACGGSGCFDASFTVVNLSDRPATVSLTYLTSGGTTIERTFDAPPLTRLTRSIAADLSGETTFSARLVSDRPILVERPAHFSF